MTGLTLVIFDCDGVLIDSQVIQARVDAAEPTRLGHPITAEEAGARFLGVTTAAMQAAAMQAGAMQAEVERVLGRTLPADFEATRDRRVPRRCVVVEDSTTGVGAGMEQA